MSREKQIDEMARIIDDNHGFIVSSVETAKALYNDGYRKASEVAREIIAEILEIVSYKYESVTTDGHLNMRYGRTDTPEAMRNLGKSEMLKYIGDKIAELKKKYTQGKEEIPPYVRMDAKVLPAILNVKYTEGEKENGI